MGHVMDGKWKQLKGKVKAKWGELTDDDLDQIQGNREMLIGKLQETYGKERREAEKDVDQFFDQLVG